VRSEHGSRFLRALHIAYDRIPHSPRPSHAACQLWSGDNSPNLSLQPLFAHELTKMAPPGRRKSFLLRILPLCVLLWLAVGASAAPAVLGIDLGTEYLKAAIAKPGSPIEIVLTKDSKRKEAATLAFKPSRTQAKDDEVFPERLYGGDAIALSARYPADVYPNLKSLLGLEYGSETAKSYASRYPGLQLECVPRSESCTVGFRSQNFAGKEEVFMVEELLAMELKNIKANAEASVPQGTVITDVVITHPAFYTAEEKRALELAAQLAGFRLLGLASDGLAVGLNYATHRVFDSVTEGAQPEYHLVYDMGAGSTTATVLKFQGRTVKGPAKRNQTIQEVQVLGTGYDVSLGGDSLNDVIVDDMVTQFLQEPKVQKLGIDSAAIRRHGKSMARFWKDAERLRHILSANTLSAAYFEGLYDDDVNFKYSLTRERFEILAADHAARVGTPLQEALASAGVSLSQLDSIILHGGAVRTPFVQKQLERAVEGANKIKTNVNADEAAVMGAAFKAASLSTSFRVKDIRGTDIAGAAVSMKWTTAENKEKQQRLFPPSSPVGTEKQVRLKSLEDVKLEFAQSVGGKDTPILAVEATNLTQSASVLKGKHGCVAANISTIFTIRLSPWDGLPEVVAGSVSCEAQADKQGGGIVDDVKGLFGFGSKRSLDQEPLGDEQRADESSTTLTPLPASDPTRAGSTTSPVSPTESATASKSAKPGQPSPSTISIPLALSTTPLGLNLPPVASLPQIRRRLSQFDLSDRNAAHRAEALNTLESFTYRARDHLEDESFLAVLSHKGKQELETQLSAISEWLYGEGVDARLEDFKDQLKALRSLVDPALRRKDEATKREEAVKFLKDGLESVIGVIKMVEGRIQKAAGLASSSVSTAASSSTTAPTDGDELEDDPYSTTTTAAEATESEAEEPAIKPYEYSSEDLSLLTKAYDSVQSWLDEKLALQEKLAPHEDPALLVAELESKLKELQTLVSETIMKTIKMQEPPRKPKSSKKGKPKSTKAKTSKETASSSTAATSTPSTTMSASKSTSVKDEL